MTRTLAPSVQAVIGGTIRPESEQQFQDNFFVPLFTALKWRGYHTHDSRRSNAGFPDWILVRSSRMIATELKSDTGTLSPEQALWLAWLEEAGAETYVWRPRDKKAIAEVLR